MYIMIEFDMLSSPQGNCTSTWSEGEEIQVNQHITLVIYHWINSKNGFKKIKRK